MKCLICCVVKEKQEEKVEAEQQCRAWKQEVRKQRAEIQTQNTCETQHCVVLIPSQGHFRCWLLVLVPVPVPVQRFLCCLTIFLLINTTSVLFLLSAETASSLMKIGEEDNNIEKTNCSLATDQLVSEGDRKVPNKTNLVVLWQCLENPDEVVEIF